jgi:colicin import membrane protein
VAQQETSALFSLKELMRLEESRIEEERAQRQRTAEAAERARQEAARMARENELARVRAEEERRREAGRRARDEAARIEAVRFAEVERVRVEAFERAKSEALSAQRAHEQRLAAIGAGESKKRLRVTMWSGAAAFVLLAAGGAGIYFGHLKPSAAERARGLEAIIAQRRAETDRMQKALDDQNRIVRDLQDQMKPAAPPERKPAAAPPKPAAPAGKITHPPPPKPPPPCTCDPHDPLCGCFAR